MSPSDALALHHLRELERQLHRCTLRVRSCIEARLSASASSSGGRCIVCYSGDKEVVMLPCSHLATCVGCANNLTKCPVCRAALHQTLRIYSA
jgi:hypothetical protein